MGEGIVHGLPVTSGIAGGGATEDVVGIGALSHKGAAAMVGHAGEQVAGGLVGLRERHVAGHGELVQQRAAAEVFIAEVFACAAVGKSCTADAPIRTVAGRDSVLHRSVLAVYRVSRNDRIHSLFG